MTTPVCTSLLPEVRSEDLVLSELARHITHVGWGIDQIVGDLQLLTTPAATALPGERWLPAVTGAGNLLRTMTTGTLPALASRHRSFLNRFSKDGFQPVPPLADFQLVNYRLEYDPPEPAWIALQFLQPDAGTMRSFHTSKRSVAVAGMLRHAAGAAAEESRWEADRIAPIIYGHASTVDRAAGKTSSQGTGITPQASADIVGTRRLAYIPLPSLEYRGGRALVVGSVRRALIASLSGECPDEVRWVQRSLAGQELIDQEGLPQALLAPIPNNDKMVQRYVAPAACWSTVTPVILPGHDDHHAPKAERLLRKALQQVGYPPRLVEAAELEWRNVSFLPGGDLASRIFVPTHLRENPRYHVRMTWRKSPAETIAQPGPLCVGGGRDYGLGLIASAALSHQTTVSGE